MNGLDTEVVVVGAGPCGIAAACALERHSIDVRILEKGSLLDSIRRFPEGMRFFSTADLLEMDGLPFPASTSDPKPLREDAIQYWAAVARHRKLKISVHAEVHSVERRDGGFIVKYQNAAGSSESLLCRAVVLATGAFERPKMLQIPGEDLPHVTHYYTSPLDYAGARVLIIGGRNSAAEAALSLARAGVRVTLAHRRNALDPAHVKYWILPDLLNRARASAISLKLGFVARQILADRIELESDTGAREWLECDRVLCLTGYGPDPEFLRRCGLVPTAVDAPPHDPATHETAIPGLFVAGTVCAGAQSGVVFVENGRFHGDGIAATLRERGLGSATKKSARSHDAIS